MADFTRQIQSKLQGLKSKVKKKTKQRMASVDHKKASRCLEKGRQYYNKKKYIEAERFFAQALDADPLYPLGHYMMGLILFKRDDVRGAKRHWEVVIKIDPKSDIALKADKKLEAIKAKKKNVIKILEDRLKF